ncbi:MAG: hypothetical protein AB1796_13305 [Bacillota bacterium]
MIPLQVQFNLTISAEKSKILEFGRFAAANRVKRGAGKLETFDFLGFTHYCSMNIKGKFRVKRKTSRKKYKAKIQLMKQWVKDNRNTPIWDLMKMLRLKLTGHYRYYGITDNYKGLSKVTSTRLGRISLGNKGGGNYYVNG